jgi:hypothetical protein
MQANAGTGGGGGGPVTIGPAEDGNYADGLFTDFTDTTPVGTAVDRFNEILKSLSPQGPPIFTSISCSTAGVNGKLSFGSAAPVAGYTNANFINRNGAFTAAANTRLGIINASTAITGVLANNVTPNYVGSIPYANNCFSDADKGMLYLEVNGYIIHQIDLTAFTSGSDLNVNGSGFNLSAATAVKFANGDPFSVFQFRTGTWTVAAADQIAGYNTLRITHEPVPGTYRDSQVLDWVVDAETVNTVFNAESLTGLAMTGSKKISGVEYHTAGTFKYNVTILNAYRNTYSVSATAISYNPTNATVVKDGLPAMVANTDTVTIANKVCTIAATRLLNGLVSVNTTVDRTVQADVTSTGVSLAGILMDTVADSSSATVHTFNGEARRISTAVSLTATNYGIGSAGSQQSPWDSSQSLVGANGYHNTGLLVYNGLLQYPKINFSTITNGPAANVNYSAAAGLRTWIGYFYDAAAHSNFRFNITGTALTFVTIATGASANNLTFEVCAPNTTKNGSGTAEWKDATKPHSGLDTDLGCYASTYGNVIPTSWGCTLGAKNTSTSGNVILVRITAAAAWTGSISQISISWL